MKKFLSILLCTTFLLSFLPAKGQAANVTGREIVLFAERFKDKVPYLYGGTTVEGFDCSGFVLYVFNHFGISLPRTSEAQYKVGIPIERSELQVGDLVYFSNTGKEGISHSGIYVGNNDFISATSSAGVQVVSMDNVYWSAHYTGAKRVLSETGTAVGGKVEQQTEIPVATSSFHDLSSGHFAYEAIGQLTGNGIVNGFSDGSFRPSASVTRGQAAAIINRVLKHTPKNIVYFSDVYSRNGFAKDIAAIKELGVINGFPDGTFRPNDTMTRAQMAVIVKNAFNIRVTSYESVELKSVYKDVPSTYWAHDAIVTMNRIDRTGGFKTTNYRFNDHATRADFTTAVYNGLTYK